MKTLNIIELESISQDIQKIYDSKDSIQYIPSIYNFSKQGTFFYKTPGLTVRKIKEKSIVTSKSDIIQVGDNCIFDKSRWLTSTKTIFGDHNLVKFDRELLKLVVADHPVVGVIKKGYSLLGTNSDHWGHFISEYYPSFLAALPILDEDVVIIIPSNLDQIQINLILYALEYNKSKNLIVKCPQGCSVIVDELFLAEKSSLLADHANWLSIYDCISQEFCNYETAKFTNNIKKISNSKNNAKKIFLTRRGRVRNVLNIEQVEKFFHDNGYLVIDPGQLSHEKRIEIFSNCEVLSGIYGSAFYNLIYAQSIQKVKIIAPLSRCIDQVYLNIFKVKEFEYHVVDSLDDSIHPEISISREICENVIS